MISVVRHLIVLFLQSNGLQKNNTALFAPVHCTMVLCKQSRGILLFVPLFLLPEYLAFPRSCCKLWTHAPHPSAAPVLCYKGLEFFHPLVLLSTKSGQRFHLQTTLVKAFVAAHCPLIVDNSESIWFLQSNGIWKQHGSFCTLCNALMTEWCCANKAGI